MRFRWIGWNLDHVGKHGVSPEEAETVVRGARRPFPRVVGDEKLLAWGPGQGGRLLQVVWLVDDDGTVFVIHARPLTPRERRRLRRRLGQ